MAKLTDEEKATLKRLREKRRAPEGPAGNTNFNIDMSDDKAVARAQKFGILPSDDDDGDDDDDDDDDDQHEPPRRRGYFDKGK